MHIKKLFILILFFIFSQTAFSQNIIWKAEIRGTINPAVSSFVKETIEKAQNDHAQALIIELDTPGGLLASTREIAQVIDASRVPVVVYVSPAGASATSAGALIMLSSHIAAMAPGTNIGAAHPVDSQGKEAPGAMGEKVLNDTAAFARGLAEVRGRNTSAAEMVVRKSKSFTAQEALKDNLINIIASQEQELFEKLNQYVVTLNGEKITIQTTQPTLKVSQMTFGQKLLSLLADPNIAAILMSLAMLLIYIEISNPGITIAGIAGVICLLLAFMAFQVLPIQTGGVVLLIFGIIMMILDPLIGTGGIVAGGGFISFILGMVWVIDPAEGDLRIQLGVLIPLALGLGFGIAMITFAAARTNKLARETREKLGGGTVAAGLLGYKGHIDSVSDDGRSGKVSIRGEIWNFYSDGALNINDSVKVVQTDGFKVKVIKI